MPGRRAPGGGHFFFFWVAAAETGSEDGTDLEEFVRDYGSLRVLLNEGLCDR